MLKRQHIEQDDFSYAHVREFRKFKTITDLLQDAKANGTKGSLQSYNYYKNELSKFINADYEQSIRKLSQILKV